MSTEMMLQQLKQLSQDHTEVVRVLGELKGEVTAELRNLSNEIKSLREVDQKIHDRIDKKDERIRTLERQINLDEQRITVLETTNRNNRLWIATSFAAAVAIGTCLALFF